MSDVIWDVTFDARRQKCIRILAGNEIVAGAQMKHQCGCEGDI
jgi:hypothetical protein